MARTLVGAPKLIVCDEPTASLDARTGGMVMSELREIAVQPDRAVIVVSHDPRVFGYGDMIAEMADGQVVNVRVPSTEEKKPS